MIARRRCPRNTRSPTLPKPNERMPSPSGPRWAIACSIEASVASFCVAFGPPIHPAIPHMEVIVGFHCLARCAVAIVQADHGASSKGYLVESDNAFPHLACSVPECDTSNPERREVTGVAAGSPMEQM